MSSQTNHGGPYRPTTWSLGGAPDKHIDVPVTAVFLALFVGGAATHMTIFQLNNRRNHKFIFSVVMFGFCMSRIVTTSLRLASVLHPTNLDLAIATAVFVAAATLILFIINLLWAQRILRSLHPHIGWHRAVSIAFRAIYVVTFLTLAMNITTVVQSFFTLRPRTRKIDRSVQLYDTTFLAILASLPYFVVGAALALPRRAEPEKFGSGKLRTKILVLMAGTTLMSLGAWYRMATNWQTPVPMSRPLPGYFSKACFYFFNFGVEVLTIYLYATVRVDLRFHVPNGAKGTYAVGEGKVRSETVSDLADEEQGEEKDAQTV